MREIDWDDYDEFPEGEDARECDYCGFSVCVCDDLNDEFDDEMDRIYGDD